MKLVSQMATLKLESFTVKNVALKLKNVTHTFGKKRVEYKKMLYSVFSITNLSL